MMEKPPPLTPPPKGEGLNLAPPSFLEKGVAGLGVWFVFLLSLAVWTWKLLEPSPVPRSVEEEIPTDLKFILSKLLHAGAYAFLTVFARYLPMRRPYFWLTIALLALHGVGTEIGQTFVKNRSGSVRDVVIDWVGIVLGLIAVRFLLAPERRGAYCGREPPEPHP